MALLEGSTVCDTCYQQENQSIDVEWVSVTMDSLRSCDITCSHSNWLCEMIHESVVQEPIRLPGWK